MLLPIFLASCNNQSEEAALLNEANLPQNNSGGKASHRQNELMPFFERDLKAERVIADSNNLGVIVFNKIKPLLDDKSATLETNIGGALLNRLKTGSYAPIHAEVNDGLDNDEINISLRSIVLSGDPILTNTLEGVHMKSRSKLDENGDPETNVTKEWAVMYTYSAVYKVTMLVEFDDQDGGFSDDDQSQKITIDFPVVVKRLTEWEK